MKNLWKNNRVQFARLIAEINAVGLSQEQLNGLSVSMELSEDEIFDIFERAEKEFQEVKRKL